MLGMNRVVPPPTTTAMTRRSQRYSYSRAEQSAPSSPSDASSASSVASNASHPGDQPKLTRWMSSSSAGSSSSSLMSSPAKPIASTPPVSVPSANSGAAMSEDALCSRLSEATAVDLSASCNFASTLKTTGLDRSTRSVDETCAESKGAENMDCNNTPAASPAPTFFPRKIMQSYSPLAMAAIPEPDPETHPVSVSRDRSQSSMSLEGLCEQNDSKSRRRSRRRPRPPTRVPNLSESSRILSWASNVPSSPVTPSSGPLTSHGDFGLGSTSSSIASMLLPILAAVPARHQNDDLRLVYSTCRDGASLRRFYSLASKCTGPLLLLVRDSEDAVFGAYTPDPRWRVEKEYFGSGEAFVFSLAPTLQVYPWARNNKYFQLGRPESLAVGGGGAFALCLDDMFERGSSGACATFDSPCLASERDFEVTVFEAWEMCPHLP